VASAGEATRGVLTGTQIRLQDQAERSPFTCAEVRV
jgi:hypothetical protein